MTPQISSNFAEWYVQTLGYFLGGFSYHDEQSFIKDDIKLTGDI